MDQLSKPVEINYTVKRKQGCLLKHLFSLNICNAYSNEYVCEQ